MNKLQPFLRLHVLIIGPKYHSQSFDAMSIDSPLRLGQILPGLKTKTVTFLITVPKVYAVYVLRTLRNVSGRSCRENQSTYFITFLRKSCRLWDNAEKYCRAGRAKDDNVAHAHCMVDT
jgi:hypothetical protein